MDALRILEMRAANCMFSRTVRSEKMQGTCILIPRPRRQRMKVGNLLTSDPLKTTLPWSGACLPVKILKNVLLPAPLGPMIACIG